MAEPALPNGSLQGIQTEKNTGVGKSWTCCGTRLSKSVGSRRTEPYIQPVSKYITETQDGEGVCVFVDTDRRCAGDEAVNKEYQKGEKREEKKREKTHTIIINKKNK